jgi:hypothetical protein
MDIIRFKGAKMKIYVHLEMLGFRLRLQNDGSFRKYKNDYNENDFYGNSKYEIEKMVIPNTLKFEAKNYKINSHSIDLAEIDEHLCVKYYSFIEGYDPVKVPDIEQLRQCVKYGNDKLGNTLVLSVYGDFILVNEFVSIYEPFCVLRYEFSAPGNGYIGKACAEDKKYIDSIYATGLKHFKLFLENGVINHFSDTYDSTDDISKDRKYIIDLLSSIKQRDDEED